MKKLLFLCAATLFLACTSNPKEEETENTPSSASPLGVEEKALDTIPEEQRAEWGYTQSDFYILERLPEWLLDLDFISELVLEGAYKIENRLNPLYLEAEFNGDGHLDCALPIREIKTDKVGFAIIHGHTKKVCILGAGREISNGLSDDLNYIDLWRVNRNVLNEAGLEEDSGTGPKGELILQNPSLDNQKSEVGGGLIYWTGEEYAYFHQTC